MSLAFAGRLFNPLLQMGRRVLPKSTSRFAPASMLDTVTNPRTYSNLADEATEALGQLLPPQFRGAGFQNVPTNALNSLDDLRNLPAGPIKEMAQRKAAQQFSKAAGSGTVRVPVIPTGGQRVVPGTVKVLPDDIAKGASTTLKQPGFLNRLNPLRNPGRILNPMSLRGGLLYGTLAEPVLSRLGMDEGDKAAVQGGLFMPGGPVMKTLGALAAHDMFNPVAKGTMDTPEAQRGNELYDQLRTDTRPKQGADLDMAAIRQMSEAAAAPQVQPPASSTPPNTPPVIPQTDFPSIPNPAARPYAPSDNAGNVGATYGNGTSTMPHANVANTVLPPNAEQILQADPMQIYQQARNAAVGQDQAAMNKVRDLGLAIHRQQFPGMYASETAMPGSMTAKDEGEALTEMEPSQINQAMLDIYSGNQPVLDPNKFLQLQLSGRVAR